MACELTQDFTIGCINSKGGVKILYVADYDDLVTPPTIVAGAVTAMALTVGAKFWTYNLEKQNASFAQSLKKDYNTGTVFYDLKYDWNIKKMSVATLQELSILAQKRLLIIHKDNNGLYWLGGVENGCDLMTDDTTSGKAFSELNGSTLSVTGEEPSKVFQVPDGIVATLIVPAV